MEEYFDPEI